MTRDETKTGVAFEADSPAVDTSGIDREKAQRGMRLLLEAIGQNPERDDLRETWLRRVPATLGPLSEGYRNEAKPTMKTFDSETGELVVKAGIPIYSLCKHHFLPFHGTVHLAYRPNGAVVGLSKLIRYVRWQSRRLTIQEQLTSDIANGLAEELGAEVVMVELDATHLCEAMRGIETETETVTRVTVGTPTENELQRFHTTIKRGGEG